MTIKRKFGKSTPFSEWLRLVKKLDSKKGFYTTDLDFVWYCDQGVNSGGKYFLIETKNKMAEVKGWQDRLLRKIARPHQNNLFFKGLVYLQFENTSPENGKIFWNSVEITKEQLIDFLAFEKDAPAKTSFVRQISN